MSYILDALRKSDEERKKNQTERKQSNFTFANRGATTPKKKNTAALILTSFMLLTALIMAAGWWWSQDDQDRSLTLPEKLPEAETVIENTPDKETSSSADEAVITADSAQTDKVDQVQTETEQQPFINNSTPPDAEIATTEQIPYLSELSSEFQAALPELKFSGHVYSPTPGLRMIMINNSVVREGDPITADLTLVEITETGLIMRLRDTLFQVKLF